MKGGREDEEKGKKGQNPPWKTCHKIMITQFLNINIKVSKVTLILH